MTPNAVDAATQYRLRKEALRITEVKNGDASHFLIEDQHSGKRHRLYEKEYLVAHLFDGERPLSEVTALARKRGGIEAQEIDIDRFALQLVALGFVERVSGVSPRAS
jgi:hypothetical protein